MNSSSVQRIVKSRRDYNSWVATETLEDYALRYTPLSFRRWSELRIANTALGAVSFLALEAIGAGKLKTLWYGVIPQVLPQYIAYTVNTKDGNPVQVRRGDILLFVTFRPSASGEISFAGGYPFAGGSTVKLDVDGTTYDLITDGEWAWPGTKDDDAAILSALKKGTTAVLTAKSGKGTQTKDTFSLRGFTAAMEDAAKRCG